MRGRRIIRVRRRGKMLLVECEGGRTLVFHLKMTGQFLFAAEGTPRDKHVRLAVCFEDGRDELRFRDVRKFGFLLCLEGEPERACGELACLGPEPLEVGLPEFRAILEARKGRIKSLLLDQTRIAGIGNIYADETLFGARVHPETPASSLRAEAVERLYLAMRKILASAVEAGGSTLTDAVITTRTGTPAISSSPTRSMTGKGSPVSSAGPHPVEAHRRPLEPFLPRCQRKPRSPKR